MAQGGLADRSRVPRTFGWFSRVGADGSLAGSHHDHVTRRLLAGAAVAAVLLAAAPAAVPAAAQTRVAAAPHAQASAPAPLTVHVSLSKHRVRIGHRLKVTYSWKDGNGDLVDTNHIGTMALHVVRNVPCTRTGTAPHAIGKQGSWYYKPQAAFTGAFTHSVKIKVGFNVRTGGCARIEEATDTETVTVLPAL